MKTLTLPDGKLAYEQTGEGTPVLFIHAGVADSRMWDVPFGHLAARFHVVRCDLRGFGDSPLPDATFAYHEDVEALIDALGIGPVWVVDASFGGQVAIDLALECPERVCGLVLVSPSVAGFQPGGEVEEFNRREDELLEAGQLDEAAELNVRMWVDGPHRGEAELDPAIRQQVREMQLMVFERPEPEHAELREPEPPAIDRLSDVRVPTLIMSGSLDAPEFLGLSEMLTREIPTASRTSMPGAAHLLSLEAPEEFTWEVAEFIVAHGG